MAPALCSSRSSIIISIGCISVIAILGIASLILGMNGYFTFHDPCIGVETFEITDMDLETANDNSILGYLDKFTGGLASELVPTQAVMTIRMILEVNNTNPYDLQYEQVEEGLIEIIPTEEEKKEGAQDLVVGNWELPEVVGNSISEQVLKSNARNEIPVEITTTIDLLTSDAAGLAGDFITGKLVVFRVRGAVEGSGWLPGATGQASFLCLANVDNVLDFDAGANIKCKHYTRVGKGRIIRDSGELEFAGLSVFDDEDDEVDLGCLV